MTPDELQAIGRLTNNVREQLLDAAARSHVHSLALEAAAVAVYTELAIVRVVGTRQAAANKPEEIAAACRVEFERNLAAILAAFARQLPVADAIADAELAAERKQRS